MSTKAKKLSQIVEEREFSTVLDPVEDGATKYVTYENVLHFQADLVKQIRKLELSVTVAQAEAKYYKDLATSAQVTK